MDSRPDVLIIGGGVIGVCSAHFLASAGARVTLVEQTEICGGCSYGNAGLICPSHSVPLAAPGVMLKALHWMWRPDSPFYIKPRLSADLIAWLWRFSRAARQGPMERGTRILRDLHFASLGLYEEFAAAGLAPASYRHQGYVCLFRSAEALAGGVREARFVEPLGVRADVLDEGGTRSMVPQAKDGVVGGIYFRDDAHVNPAEFVRGLARCARERGVVIHEGTTVTDFVRADGRISEVRTSQGEFRPDCVVVATGAWSRQMGKMLGLTLPVEPAKGYHIMIPKPEDFPAQPVSFTERKVIATPMGDRLRFAGTLELAGFDRSINWRRVAAIRKAAAEYLEPVGDLEAGDVWCGMRPCSPDGLPIIGRAPGWKNVVVATGHGMLGLSLGPVTGKLVSQIVAGEETVVDIAGVGVERFGSLLS